MPAAQLRRQQPVVGRLDRQLAHRRVIGEETRSRTMTASRAVWSYGTLEKG
jgi:hypothetical protein